MIIFLWLKESDTLLSSEHFQYSASQRKTGQVYGQKGAKTGWGAAQSRIAEPAAYAAPDIKDWGKYPLSGATFRQQSMGLKLDARTVRFQTGAPPQWNTGTSAKRTVRAPGYCAQTSKQPLGILAHIQEPCREVVQEKRLSLEVLGCSLYNRCTWSFGAGDKRPKSRAGCQAVVSII